MPKYISNHELAELIKTEGKVAGKDYLVVDVRDDDFAGGNITNARNIPSREFSVAVYDLAQKSKEVEVMVFHCALSQARGPKAARIYEETRQNLNIPAEHGPQEVLILRGGFTEFQRKFHTVPALVEKWDPEVWEGAEEWS
ncbi:Rhodanese domain-containing protein [Mycena kentingensis (nom. inval.)]|nr:Rhodanese domain-containing protein [Mycena kentingensis (nom. inval.)]